MDVFVSVGSGLNSHQEAFVAAVEERLRAIGVTPRTIGRNTFSADAPLKSVTALMDSCVGAVVIALERFYFPAGVERRDSDQQGDLDATSMPTSWNQIEAAMAYGRGLPLLVIVDDRIRADGLLEKGNDWFVQAVPLDELALTTPAFLGILESWRSRLPDRSPGTSAKFRIPDPGALSVGQILAALKPGQLWAAIVATAAILGVAFTLGGFLFP